MSADFAFQPKDYWRSIILYGLNTATDKIALGYCIASFALEDKTYVSMTELAEEFFAIYSYRLFDFGRPQLALPQRLTVMERIYELYNTCTLTHTEAVQRVEQEAFKDVIPRFHTIANLQLMQFYEYSTKGLVLTDNLLGIFGGGANTYLFEELNSRWALLEVAFELRRKNLSLKNDECQFYLEQGSERTDLTYLDPVLNGYQNGLCFYCGEPIIEGHGHVDHVIPREFIYHDELWNLVLAHKYCKLPKFDALPSLSYIEKLIERNEHLVASNHPLRKKFIEQFGPTPEERSRSVRRIYQKAETAIPYTWKGIRGYEPSSDNYRSLMRHLNLLRRLS